MGPDEEKLVAKKGREYDYLLIFVYLVSYSNTDQDEKYFRRRLCKCF